ncbi:MAG: hypothetical protein ACPLXP_00740 [Microgenomates group bacterium]
MGKKRKTRQEKIILQLKRKLAAQKAKEALVSPKLQLRQEAISYRPNKGPEAKLSSEKPNNAIFSYDPKLVKKDILKTIILSLVIIGLQVVLYLRLR